MSQLRFFKMNRHDCHVLMKCMLLIAFKELPNHVWKPLIELSEYFRYLCSSIHKVNDPSMMEKNIPIILCNLERIVSTWDF